MLDHGKSRICFVSNTAQERAFNDGSTRYRCFYPAYALRKLGYYAAVMPQRDFLDTKPVADFYFFHRPRYSNEFADEVNKLKALGRQVVADYDDLIFGVDNMKQSSLYKTSLRSVPVSSVFYDNTRSLRLFDKVSVSTPTLKSLVEKYNPGASVVVARNCLPGNLLDFGEMIAREKKLTSHTIGYFPGTKTHDADFRTWGSALKTLLERTSIRFTLMGELSPQLTSDLPRLHRIQGGSFLTMISRMSEVSIVIAPLEPTIFNACKSNIKSIEAFATGCYSISTPHNDVYVLRDLGADIFIVNDEYEIAEAYEQISRKSIVSDTNIGIVRENFSSEKRAIELINNW